MKLTVRILSILLVFTMVFAIAACNGDTQTPASPSPSVSDNAPSSEEPTSSASPENQVEDPDAPEYGGVFISAVPQEPSMLFANYRVMNGYTWISAAVESLGRRNPATSEVEPLLAESFKQDNLEVTIKLKEGIKFSDGSELTADVVRWNFELALENGLGSTLLNPIEFECPDKYTILIKYDTFYLNAIQAIAERPIYSQKAYEDNGLDWCLYHPVGTGPFVFKEYIDGNKITYVRRDDYWQDGKPYLDGWEIHIIPETTTAMVAFENNEITGFGCSDRALNDVIQGLGHKNSAYPTFDNMTFTCMAPSNKDENDPWFKKEVRQAVFLYGLDYSELAMLTYGKTAIPWHQTGIEGALFYDPEIESAYTYDLDKAKQMLADAGYADGFTTDILGIAANTPFATALQDALKRLNITGNVIEINASDPVRMDGSMRGLVVLNGMTNWDGFIRPIGSMMNSNVTHYFKHVDFSDEYDELFLKGRDAKTYEERAQYGKELQRLLHVDECYMAMAFVNQSASYIQDYVRGEAVQYNVRYPDSTWFSTK